MAHAANLSAFSDPVCDRLEQLRAAIDAKIMMLRLAASWPLLAESGIRLTDLAVERVHRRGDTFVIHYVARLDRHGRDEHQDLFAELVDDASNYLDDVLVKLKKPRRHQLAWKSEPDSIFAVRDPGLVLRPPGLDERLPGLRLLHDPAHVAKVFALHCKRPADDLDMRADLLAHRLGKRAVLRLTATPRSGGPPATLIAKCYKSANGKGRRTHLYHQALYDTTHAGETIAVPKPLAFDEVRSLSLLEDVGGRPLRFDQPYSLPDVINTGRAAARFHQLPVTCEAAHCADDEFALLEDWAALTSTVFPDLGRLVERARRTVSADLRRVQSAPVALSHRDFHEKQVLLGERAVIFIDFDTLAMSDPALDIGNFLAHARLAALQTGTDNAAAEAAFRNAYGPVAGDGPTARIDIYRRASLMRLGCLYAFTSQWQCLSPTLLAEAAP